MNKKVKYSLIGGILLLIMAIFGFIVFRHNKKQRDWLNWVWYGDKPVNGFGDIIQAKYGVIKTPYKILNGVKIMSNPFGVHRITKSEAIGIIKAWGLNYTYDKKWGNVIPKGDEKTIHKLIDWLVEQRIYIENNSINVDNGTIRK